MWISFFTLCSSSACWGQPCLYSRCYYFHVYGNMSQCPSLCVTLHSLSVSVHFCEIQVLCCWTLFDQYLLCRSSGFCHRCPYHLSLACFVAVLLLLISIAMLHYAFQCSVNWIFILVIEAGLPAGLLMLELLISQLFGSLTDHILLLVLLLLLVFFLSFFSGWLSSKEA